MHELPVFQNIPAGVPKKPTPEQLAIGEQLAKAIKRTGQSQNAFAKGLGLSRSTLSSWTHGVHQPPLEMLAEICRKTGVSADTILNVGDLKEPAPDLRPFDKILAQAERLVEVARDVREGEKAKRRH